MQNKENSKLKDFGIDLLFIIGAFGIHFIYGGISALFNIPFNYYVSLGMGYIIFAGLLTYRPFASLYYGILNLNIIMILIFSIHFKHKSIIFYLIMVGLIIGLGIYILLGFLSTT